MESIKSLKENLQEKNLLPDILVKNAGTSTLDFALRISNQDWNHVINTNLTSVFELSVNAANPVYETLVKGTTQV